MEENRDALLAFKNIHLKTNNKMKFRIKNCYIIKKPGVS